MNFIKSLSINGFKKFKALQIDFNEHMNILVGENEAGKSTILDAIRTVLNQQYRNADKAVLKDLFNRECVEAFVAAPSIDTLPRIVIEAELELNPKSQDAEYFYGEVYGDRRPKDSKYGIRFECSFNEELGYGLAKSIQEGKIPYEYYTLTWNTFGNKPYYMVKRPLQFISVDTSNSGVAASFNYYNRTLFSSKYDPATQTKAKNDFREKLEKAFEEIDLPSIDEHRKFGIDGKKVVLETILSVYEDSIALENRGSGMESLIKTQITLDKKNGLDVILIEEPENHLCFANLRKMLKEISKRQGTSQQIIATHSNMIASGLNLNNVLWIADDKVVSLKTVNADVADFFVKADHNGFLQLLLSKKTFLVEGATECLLMPLFYKKITGKSIEEDGITIISCNGISYKKYLSIATATDKRLAVITDNDKKQSRIEFAINFNQHNTKQHIFMSNSTDDWTWERCIYRKNQKKLDSMIELKPNAQYLFLGEDYGKAIGYMLNHKVDMAYKMLVSGEEFEAPQYVEDAILWLSK